MAKFSLPSIPFEKVAALSLQQRIAVCVGTYLLLGGGFFYFMYMPNNVEITELRQMSHRIQLNLAQAKSDAKNLEIYQRQYKEAEGRFKLALQLLPDKKEIPNLLDGISRSGRHSGLEFLLFQPAREVLKEFYVEIPVKIQVIGGYHNLAMFFDKVAKLPRIVNISNLSIKGTGSSRGAVGPLQATCIAITYQFVEAPKAETKMKGKSRRR